MGRCHNLVVLIHEMCELGIDPVFWLLQRQAPNLTNAAALARYL